LVLSRTLAISKRARHCGKKKGEKKEKKREEVERTHPVGQHYLASNRVWISSGIKRRKKTRLKKRRQRRRPVYSNSA